MEAIQAIALASDIMTAYAAETGVDEEGTAGRRYLWTDAFAVCNWLGLFRQHGDIAGCRRALRLIDLVHAELGRHRADDTRTGWLSGLEKEAGQRHPTAGGLRIGKPKGERAPEEAADERLEWDRDGQYFHYLTKWMQALRSAWRSSGDFVYLRWAVELAAAAHARFTYMPSSGGRKKLYWKMSVDLSRPLVIAMGQHDPLDGFITFSELQLAATEMATEKEAELPDLREAVSELAEMCRGGNWATEDPLGTGGLLVDAWRLTQLMLRGEVPDEDLLENILDAALLGLESFTTRNPFRLPAAYRLPFRELGLAIGLKGYERLRSTVETNPQRFGGETSLQRRMRGFQRYLPLGEKIQDFWVEERNRRGETWRAHGDINMVMLASSLVPSGYLEI